MNILVTAIGSFSAEAVITSLKKVPEAKIIGLDINPAVWIATSKLVDNFYQIPIVYKKALYLKTILEICQKEEINFIIPLTDPEVDVLSENRKLFNENNITICISDNSVINKCRNKYSFYNYLKKENFLHLIPTYKFNKYVLKEKKFPLLAKPKTGRSSEGVFKIKDEANFIHVSKSILQKDYIIQPVLKGNVFTVDFVRNNLSGNYQAICREELIRNISGAGLTVEISYIPEIHKMVATIGIKLNIHGCVNFEFIKCKGKFYLMDINPRFSAGVAFSLLAGYDMVANHLNCFLNKEIEYNVKYTNKIIAKRYTETIM